MAKEKGADNFVVSTDKDSMLANNSTIDLLLNTVSAPHQLAHYMPLLKVNGTIVQLGLVIDEHSIPQMDMMAERKTVSASHIGGIKATEECLELCAKFGINAETQMITADQLDWAYE